VAPTRAPRQNLFVIAAVALPLLVIAFFLIATAVPRWFVAPPAYDLLFRIVDAYEPTRERVAVEFRVRDGRVEATAREVEEGTYVVPRPLYVYEHGSGAVRKISVDLPAKLPQTELTVVVDQLAGRRALAQPAAPDGYALHMPERSAPGLIGDIFGRHRSDPGLAIASRGRVVRITLPSSLRYYDPASVEVVGWLEPEDR
jgi:hypothetical protein